MPRLASNSTSPLMRIRPRVGLPIPAIALTTLVLPEPERPNKPTIGASAANLTSRWNAPRRSSISTSIIVVHAVGAPGHPLRGSQRHDGENDSDDRQAQRL